MTIYYFIILYKAYLILSGDYLDANVNLPFTTYNPIYTCIPFKVSV